MLEHVFVQQHQMDIILPQVMLLLKRNALLDLIVLVVKSLHVLVEVIVQHEQALQPHVDDENIVLHDQKLPAIVNQ